MWVNETNINFELVQQKNNVINDHSCNSICKLFEEDLTYYCMRFHKYFIYFFHNLVSQTFSKRLTYRELFLIRAFVKSVTFSIPLEGLT